MLRLGTKPQLIWCVKLARTNKESGSLNKYSFPTMTNTPGKANTFLTNKLFCQKLSYWVIMSDQCIALREEPWNDKCCSNGFCPNSFSTPPPPLKQPDPLGLLFSTKISQFFKTAVLTMGIDILKMTMVKHYS